MIQYLFNKVTLENADIKTISETFERYNTLFRNTCDSPIGTYSINNILELVKEFLNYLEMCTPIIKIWIKDYLENHRGELWLYYGITKGAYLADYWKIKETDFNELATIWPFLYKRDSPKYKDFIVDLKTAQNEVLRQRDRQNTNNPNYKPFHPDGCPSGCCCWMLDDMEQWHTEEQKEINASKNIFFNTRLQIEFYKAAVEDLGELKEQWGDWEPKWKKPSQTYNDTFSITPGQTPIKIVITWIKNDFYYSNIITMFHWSDIFKNVWENIDSVDDFIKLQREKLKSILELL